MKCLEGTREGKEVAVPSHVVYLDQKYCCCSLIAAINARVFLGGPEVTSEEFEGLAKLVCCLTGATIGVEKAYPFLSLMYKDGPRDLDWVCSHLPVEIAYFDGQYGFHSALIVGVDGEKAALVNAGEPLMEWDEIAFPRWPHQELFRSFQLIS